MATKINADTIVGGAVVTADASGILELQSAGTTALTLSGANATFAGSVSLPSPLAVAGNSTAGAEIRLPEDTDNGSNYVALKAPNALAANLTLTLPSADGTSGQVLQTDGSGTLSFATPAAGSLLRVTTFSSSGTWTKGANTKYVLVRGVGAGGGGGGGLSGNTGGGAGGGSGGYSEKFIDVTAISSVSVTIGAGGSGGGGGGNGSAGGTTSFGTQITCNGGGGGTAGGAVPGNGGSGGTASGGHLNVRGSGGGVGATPNAYGSGTGGPSFFGGGGRGATSNGQGGGGEAGDTGGGGAGGLGGNSPGSGGAGGNGVIIVEEYA